MATCQEMVDWLRSKQGQWYYTNDLTLRENPEQSGCTDCSGTTQYAYRKFFGIEIGSWTGTQSHSGWEIARGHYPSEIPWDSLRVGDLILMTANYWEQWDFAQYLCHVEIYSGNGNMIGSPSTPCPQEKNALNWMNSYGCITWMVRRIVDDGQPQPAPTPSGGGNIYMQAKACDGSVLPMVCNNNDNAGDGVSMPYLAAWVDSGTLDVQANGLPVLNNPSNIYDTETGSVGDGSPIKRLSMYYWSPNSDKAVYYRVMCNGAWLPWMKDHTDLGGSADTFAGDGVSNIQRVEAYIDWA